MSADEKTSVLSQSTEAVTPQRTEGAEPDAESVVHTISPCQEPSLDAFLRLLEVGKLLPLHPGEKRPHKSFAPNGFHDATSDRETVERWWTTGIRGYGLLVPHLIVDLDDANSHHAFGELCRSHNFDPNTWIAQTPRGLHVHFGTPPGWKCSTRSGFELAPKCKLDVRGVNSAYVVAPPTVLPPLTEDGEPRRYQWVPGGAPWECPLQSAPQWLLDLLAGEPVSEPVPMAEVVAVAAGATVPILPGEIPPYPMEIRDRLVAVFVARAIREAAVGNRNDVLYPMVVQLRDLRVPEAHAMNIALNGWHSQVDNRDFPARQVRSTVRSIYKRPMRDWPVIDNSAPAPTVLPGAAPIIDLSAQQQQAAHLAGNVTINNATGGLPPPVLQIPEGRRLSDLARQHFDELKWLLHPILPEDSLALIGGKPKSGKSFLCLEIALAVAAGNCAVGGCDKLKTGDGVPVIYLALEDGERRIRSRALAMCEKLGIDPPENLTIYCANEVPRMGQGFELFIDTAIRRTGARLLVIDTLSNIRGEAPRGASAFKADHAPMEMLQKMCLALNVSALVIHHNRKGHAEDWGDAFSGTLGISASPDVLLGLEVEPSDTRLGVLHARGRDVEEVAFALERSAAGWKITPGNVMRTEGLRSDLARQVMHRLGEVAPLGLAPREIAEALGVSSTQVRDVLRRLFKQGRVARSGGLYFVCLTGSEPAPDVGLQSVNGTPLFGNTHTHGEKSE